jgi:hypothetical protein
MMLNRFDMSASCHSPAPADALSERPSRPVIKRADTPIRSRSEAGARHAMMEQRPLVALSQIK